MTLISYYTKRGRSTTTQTPKTSHPALAFLRQAPYADNDDWLVGEAR